MRSLDGRPTYLACAPHRLNDFFLTLRNISFALKTCYGTPKEVAAAATAVAAGAAASGTAGAAAAPAEAEDLPSEDEGGIDDGDVGSDDDTLLAKATSVRCSSWLRRFLPAHRYAPS
jgi:hypothetical protein